MITFVHRLDYNNPGDYWSCPSHYFKFDIAEHVDINNIKNLKSSNKIIFGGGGLLGRITWDNSIRQLTENNDVILWGAGQNIYGQKKKGDMIGVKVDSALPDYIDNFTSIGLRDYNLGYNWVPCVSCMHLAFDKVIKVKSTKKVIAVEHNKIKLRSKDYKTINHAIAPTQLEEFLLEIAQYECVLTNTYHGAYWSLLLGKKVILQPWSSKFNNLKWNHLTIGRGEHLQPSVIELFDDIKTNNNTALEEARDANNKFYLKLFS
jgi:hypothetical protein